ncbi:MAG: twin-arginine translocase subunit TatC [Gammaproteobacteria bacterium]|nr:twin-arginine translocase subunit TatC [Gammaproteobacteria bacterium]
MTNQSNQNPAVSDDTEQPLIYHLIELRDRLLRVVLVIGVVFVVLMPFSNTLFSILSGPLMVHLPEDSSMIAIEVASPFLIPFKLTLFLALFIAIPYVLYQLWSFVAPGLYKHERRLIWPLLVSSTFLFYAGAAFAYFVVFPLVFAFFTSTAPEGVSVMTDISRYLDFVLTLFFAFGAAFEVPIFTVLLVWTGVATQDGLRQKRPYIIVGAFVVGMFLTPPDVISQTLLAVPVWLLFEVGVYFSGWFVRQTETSSRSDTHENESQGMSDAEMEAELDRLDAEEKD